MRILLSLLMILMIGSLAVHAEPFTSSKVENIDLKLSEDEIAVSFLGLAAGEAILVHGSNGKHILINAGGNGTKSELEKWLSLYGVKEIPTLILTNDGQELSFTKIDQLISKYSIKKIITTLEISRQLIKYSKQAQQIPVIVWTIGTKKEIIPKLTAEVQFIGHGQSESMDLKMQVFKHNIFLMSSLSQEAGLALLKKNLKNINIIKLPNCRKETRFLGDLIDNLNPQVAILFAAEKQKPCRDILHELNHTWSEIYLAKKHASITIKFTKTNYEVITIPIEVDE